MGIRTRETSEYFPKVKKSREDAEQAEAAAAVAGTSVTTENNSNNNSSASTSNNRGGSKSPRGVSSATVTGAKTTATTVEVISPGTTAKATSNNISKGVVEEGQQPSPPPKSVSSVDETKDKVETSGGKGKQLVVGNKGKGGKAVVAVPAEGGKGIGGKSSSVGNKGSVAATTSKVGGGTGNKAYKGQKKSIGGKGIATTAAVKTSNKDDNSSGTGVAGRSKETRSVAGTSLPNGTGKTQETAHGSVDKGAANKLKSGIGKASSKMKKGMRIMMERTNKILERSKNCKKQTKKGAVKPRIPPARSSARLGRKSSGEGNENKSVKFREEPLRTVELIKRPLELRDPATKLLYLASLSLYPTSDPESDTTPIVIVNEEVTSPGGKKGKTRSVEFPLMPNWRGRYNNAQEEVQPQLNTSQSNRGSLLLQIAPTAAQISSTEESSQNNTEVSRPVKTAKRKSQNADVTTILEAEHLTVSRVSPPLPVNTSNSNSPSSTAKESLQPAFTATKLSISIPPVETQSSPAHHKQTEPIGTESTLPVKMPKKRKSVDTILKEMQSRKSKSNANAPKTDVTVGKTENSSSNLESHSLNPILEGLMKNPVKSKVQKRKSEDLSITSTTAVIPPNFNSIQSILPNNSTISINPISMTVPLQPAPGLPINVGISSKEFKTVKGKKQRSSFELPNPLPIPIPPGLLSFASLMPNSNSDSKPTEKPKKPRKPRVRKPKIDTNVIKSTQLNSSLISPLMSNMNSTLHPNLPYLPPHLEAFFQTPPLLNVPQPNVQALQPPPEQALDLCVKPIKVTPVVTVKPKKVKDLSKSILKPLTAMQDDTPLNLVMSRNDLNGTSVQAKLKETSCSPQQDVSTGKQGGSLDSVKQMLGRLHTRIAPAVNGVQLITIE